jgi:uncharacterized protein (TIGR00730 family)
MIMVHATVSDSDLIGIIDPIVANSDFVQIKAQKPLRICCYGSSSSETPELYLTEARSLGYMLAKRGHTCVNGAGAYGCMAAMNDGAHAGDGHIVGVIHEMWLQKSEALRDGGAHRIFHSTENAAPPDTNTTTATTTNNSNLSLNPAWNGPKREMLIAGGKDLQERKRLLVDQADALIVLPGGPGTWDELWEMACARGIGLSNLPIVCVNCDGYYEPFRAMLVRAYNDKLTKLLPHEIIQFEASAEAAVKWVKAVQDAKQTFSKTTFNSKTSMLRKSSVLHSPVLGHSDSWIRSTLQRYISKGNDFFGEQFTLIQAGMIFTAGFVVGTLVVGRSQNRIKV